MRQFRASISGSSPAPYAPGFEPKIARRGTPPVAVLGGVLVGVRAHVVGLGRLVQFGDRPYRVVDQPHHMREGVPEEAGDPDRHVDARAAEFRGRHDLEAGDPARRVVPDRPAAEQRQDLGDVVALGAHRGRAPHRQADRLRVSPVSVRYRGTSESASAWPTSHASRDGIALGSTE